MKIQFTNRMKHSDDHRMQIGGTVVPPSVSPKQTLSTPLNRGIATNSLCAGARACAQATEVTPLLDGATKFNTQDGKRHTVDHWDLIVAHPPCTYLCKVSSVWMKTLPDLFISRLGQIEHVNANRYYAMLAARDFFFQCLHAQALYVAVENPLPMAMADLPQPSCFLEPSWFGVKYTKKTLFWLRNLPPIMPELEHPYPKCFVKASRGKYRSRTFPQVAHAIARQWSEFIFNDQHPDASSLLP